MNIQSNNNPTVQSAPNKKYCIGERNYYEMIEDL